jgi:hypothetical protein
MRARTRSAVVLSALSAGLSGVSTSWKSATFESVVAMVEVRKKKARCARSSHRDAPVAQGVSYGFPDAIDPAERPISAVCCIGL